jgi:hypothetical protein
MNDELGRRVTAAARGSGFSPVDAMVWLFGYNSRGEVTAAERWFGESVDDLTWPASGQSWVYGYDPIGNRTNT